MICYRSVILILLVKVKQDATSLVRLAEMTMACDHSDGEGDWDGNGDKDAAAADVAAADDDDYGHCR